MGRYFNPATPEAIEKAGGRKLHGATHAEMSSQLQHGEALGMFNDRVAFKQVADVTDPDEFEEFESQYRTGIIVRRSFYAIPGDAFRH